MTESPDIAWEEPPKLKALQKGRLPKFVPERKELLENSGHWGIIGRFKTQAAARAHSLKIRTSQGIWSGDTWDAEVRCADGPPAVWVLYVRHVSSGDEGAQSRVRRRKPSQMTD